jgi:hypothetical protein
MIEEMHDPAWLKCPYPELTKDFIEMIRMRCQSIPNLNVDEEWVEYLECRKIVYEGRWGKDTFPYNILDLK